MAKQASRFTYCDFQRWVFALGTLLVLGFGVTLSGALAEESSANLDANVSDSASGTSPVAAQGSSSVGAMRSQSVSTGQGRDFLSTYNMNYFSIFDGPAVGSPDKYQPRRDGTGDDLNKPVLLRNYVTGGFDVDDNLAISGTAYWATQAVGDSLVMRDPFLRFAHSSLLSTDRLNLYGDLRIHFPVTTASRYADLLTGIQTFQILSYQEPSSRFTFSTFTNARMNIYGAQGTGSDLELYFGPNMSYQIHPTLAATLLYEMNASHTYGKKAFHLENDGTDLEPGVSWNITKNVNFNPYLNLYTGNKVSLNSTSVGFMFFWKFM